LMKRYLSSFIQKDLRKKCILLSGPRQVGKTTLARSLFEDSEYLNYDVVSDRRVIMSQSWNRDTPLVILDELHKYKKWKNLLKGVIDESSGTPPLLVTGSARLEVFRKAGDALTGRTFSYHLHPFDPQEAYSIQPEKTAAEHIDFLITHGGFPESFYAPELSRRLLMDRISTVLRDDLRDLAMVSSIASVELLVELLRERVGGQIRYANLANDLGVSAPTVKSWIELLQKLYLIVLLRPFSAKLAKSLRKEPKVYFYDCSAAANGEAARLENLVALALYKWCDFARDTEGRDTRLFYFRDSNDHEVDFVVTEGRTVLACIEVKSSDEEPSSSLRYLSDRVKPKHAVQLVRHCARARDYGTIKVRPLAEWLRQMAL
ncbi:MAG: ATP-binding protein, partial [Proteobacteria bacterium]|nr:ATP-binding protein [Pseudomonadota bacterium]